MPDLRPGLPDDKGAMMIQVPAGSPAFKNGLQKGDVIIKIKENIVQSANDLLQLFQKTKWMGEFEITVMRNQSLQTINIKINE